MAKSHLGIDLWHAVEFSSYGCALAISDLSDIARAASKLITGIGARSNRGLWPIFRLGFSSTASGFSLTYANFSFSSVALQGDEL